MGNLWNFHGVSQKANLPLVRNIPRLLKPTKTFSFIKCERLRVTKSQFRVSTSLWQKMQRRRREKPLPRAAILATNGSAHAQYTCMTQPKWQTAEWEIWKREERNGIGSSFNRSLSANSLVSRRKKYGKTLTFLGDMRFNESKILLMKII